jgi:hypothetical protein
LAFARSLEAWFEAQTELLASIDTLSHDWLRRRREGLDAAREAVARLSRCRDPAEMFRAQQDWFEGVLRRAQSDITAVNNGIASMTRAATVDFEATARAVNESIRGTEQEIFKAAAGKKPADRKTGG